MSNSGTPGWMTKIVTGITVLLLVYIGVLLVIALVHALGSAEPETALLSLLEVVVSGPAVLGLLAVGAGVKYERGIRAALERLAAARSPESSGAGTPPVS